LNPESGDWLAYFLFFSFLSNNLEILGAQLRTLGFDAVASPRNVGGEKSLSLEFEPWRC
jgi:hypothetical protein